MASPSNASALKRANTAANNNQSPTKVGATKQPCPIYDVIVIVAGTVDPVNTNSKKANSYHGSAHDPKFPETREDSDYYWTGNEKFINPIIAFQTEYDGIQYFPDFGWSGDNCVHNRRLAGEALGDWLCGNGMPIAKTLSALPNRKVSWHFIGHSHGGNVINEVTRRISNIGKWPATWKVKSVMYLSTPFFSKIHKPLTTRFHSAAKISNVFCDYDLTQVAIADFSLRQLSQGTHIVVGAQKTILPITDRIVKFDMNALNALKVWPSASLKLDWFKSKVETKWEMNPVEGRNLYDKVIALLKDVKLLASEVRKILVELSQPVETRISEPMKGKGMVVKRAIIPPAIANKIIAELDKILAALAPTERNFTARRASGVYPVRGFLSDLNLGGVAGEWLVLVLDLLEVDPNTLNGKLTNFLYDMFKDLIEVFDDTVHTPNHLYSSVPIVPFDCSQHDGYHGLRTTQFDKFKSRLIKCEAAYMGNPSRYNFLNLLFHLVAELEEVRKFVPTLRDKSSYLTTFVKWWTKVDSTSPFSVRMQQINTVIQSWLTILTARDCGGIVVDSSKRNPKLGHIAYLAMVSHSVSRREMYKEMDTFLRSQFDAHPKKPKR